MSNYQAYQKEVLEISQKLVEEGYLKGTGGNVSVRIPGKEALAITPSGKDYMQIKAEDICVRSFEKEELAGEHKPSIEIGFHVAVLQQRPDVNCVIHTHQPLASAVAVISKSIPALFDEQVRNLGRSVDVIPYAPSGTGFLVSKIKKAVSDHHNAYLMKNHGAISLGSTVQKAYHNVLMLEKAATAFLLALCTGEKIEKIPLAIREIAFGKLRSEQKRIEAQLAGIN